MKKLILLSLTIIILIIILSSCNYDDVPSYEQAKYKVYSEQLGNVVYIYTSNISIKEGVLTIDGYYKHYKGWILSPKFKYYNQEIILTDYSIETNDIEDYRDKE